MDNNQQTNRRTFLKQAGAAGVAAPFFVRNLISAPPSDQVRLASFGAGNMAFFTLHGIARHKRVKLACVADVDTAQFARVKAQYPEAKLHQDWRAMLEQEHKNLDIACVGTPDHMHAPIAMSAMQRGLHVYVQKPLTHDIYEARKLQETARKKKLVTQMGIQIHSSAEYQTAVQLVRTGAIGKVKEVHAWSEKKWGDLTPVPDRQDPVPATLNWDEWLGTAAARPYLARYYHPADWRKRIDFGTGTFGDMGCHIYDPVFDALQLTAPLSVRSEGPAPTEHNWAVNAVIRYVFPGTPFTAEKTVNVTWYDGDERPPAEVKALIGNVRMPGQGSIFIGTNGVMLLPHIGKPVLLPQEQFKDFSVPVLEPANHYFQFVDAVLGTAKASTAFDYSAPLTEVVLLGPVATRFPKTTLEWNAAKMKFENVREANRYIRRKYRSGWKFKGL
ncbi:MAG TPA: Gfo/Idh/MocA family oxidoreductase [Bryobacteraceae bacterium]|nr:Gfo/Idh/MocA family oxidoreductase [Bryobacteraceae bacterium]